MKNTDIINSGSIEELTVQSLDHSLEGIELLCQASATCGESILSAEQDAMSQFSSFAENLRVFYLFEKDICSLFNIDGESIRDEQGNLKYADTTLSSAMDELSVKLGCNDLLGLANVLKIDLPAALRRFTTLFPVLRNHIEHEYLAPAN